MDQHLHPGGGIDRPDTRPLLAIIDEVVGRPIHEIRRKYPLGWTDRKGSASSAICSHQQWVLDSKALWDVQHDVAEDGTVTKIVASTTMAMCMRDAATALFSAVGHSLLTEYGTPASVGLECEPCEIDLRWTLDGAELGLAYQAGQDVDVTITVSQVEAA